MFLGVGSTTSQAQPPIVQPGAPGEPSRQISAAEASDLAGIQFTEADVQFMQGMIAHHAQALEMTQLLSTRTARDTMRRLAQRIELSQEDEIAMMQDWLQTRGQTVPEPDAHHGAGVSMPGMLSQEEMQNLQAMQATEFDLLFLELMIKHHRGALTMVDNLLSQRGTAQDSQLFAFTSDITADQSMEIDRMDVMLAELFPDPRVDLEAGFYDAGTASLNMTLVATLAKPEGFYDPHAPAGLPMRREPEEVQSQQSQAVTAEATTEENTADDESTQDSQVEEAPTSDSRPGLLNFGNTDLAFKDDLLFVGNYHGFSTYRAETPSSPQLVSSVVCPGGQGDVSVVGNLLIMSVEQTRGRLDCGLQGVAEPVSEARFRGIRIFDISDMRLPKQVAAVQTCRGSHTHTLVTDPDDEGNVYVYGSGTSSVRPGEELEGCSDDSPEENPDTALFRIDVIRIPLGHPQDAGVVNRPFIFADPASGAIAGLWQGGDHGPGTQTTRQTSQCHDITVYPDIGLAAGACSGNGILLDISDPINPSRIDQVVDPGFAYWHSATFNNDGSKVIFTDEWGGGGRARCRASDPREWGADAIFDIVDGKMEFRSYFKLPAPQTEEENCVAHNGSLIPVPGRDLFLQAWYQGGISVIDFTDSSNPFEVAYFDRGPIDPDELVMGGYWSAYWYRGFIYATEIARGLDVLELLPSDELTQNEIEAASLVTSATFNPQQQRRISWSARPQVARAYLDQITRSSTLPTEEIATLAALLDRVDQIQPDTTVSDVDLAGDLSEAAGSLDITASQLNGRSQTRLAALAEAFKNMAEGPR
ncbi:MAG: DUF305 domain-containing protein [Acidobacteria bacterium]|nr:DUF305 domain-containing protein [Acidobacteriota bacterium]